MIIDFHNHAVDLRLPDEMDREPVTLDHLIKRMDEEGIDKAVLMPVNVSPEIMQAPLFFSRQSDILSQLEAAASYSERLILFGNLDPRMGCYGNLTLNQLANPKLTDFTPFLKRFKELGCVGIGEIVSNLPVDDIRVINLFRQCGEWNMPVLFHCTGPGQGVYGLFDETGLPGLEKLLKSIPNTTVIGHAPGFWSEISGNISLENKFVYAQGPVKKEGSLQRLLRTYENLYADISANSGFSAISRDKEYGVKFLIEFQDRILFGTDVCFADQKGRMPHLSYLRSLLEEKLISLDIFKKITCDNALKILKLY
jgi:uncharacterized protein